MRNGKVDEALRVLEVRKHQLKAITFSCKSLPCGLQAESKLPTKNVISGFVINCTSDC